MPESMLTVADRPERLDVMLMPGPIVLLPSSGAIHDDAAHAVATRRERRGLVTRIAVPSFRAHFTDGLDDRLRCDSKVAIVDAATIGDRGPLVIDLPVMYLPRSRRARLLMSRNRLQAAIDVWRRAPLAATVIRVAEDFWLETNDPIAAELVALTARQMTTTETDLLTPWEDELVQVATESGLGARLPREIVCDVRGQPPGVVHSGFVMALHLRIGVDIPLN